MNKKVVAFIGVLFLLFFLTVSFVAGFAVGNVGKQVQDNRTQSELPKEDGTVADLGPVREVFGQLAHGYVDKINRQKLIDGAVDGMIKALGDPYTRRLKKTDYQSFQEHTTGHFGGVGIELGMRENKLTVMAPIKNTPADKAGIQAGDRIVKINDTTTKGMALQKAVKLIRGESGTKVTLTLERNGGKSFSRDLVREEIKMPNVSGRVLDKNIGYIKVHAFNNDTAKDVKAELDGLKAKNIKGAIVDLRNNPGGLLNEAVQVSSIFIKKGAIVKVKSRSGRTDTYTANNGADDQIPLAVLVNRGSASASEIFAGAVQDTGRGVIVGERTFGKASVQTVIPLADGSGLVMTTAKYFTPKGRSLSKHGVEPDVKIKLPKKDFHKMSRDDDPQLIKAKEVIRDLMTGTKVKKAG